MLRVNLLVFFLLLSNLILHGQTWNQISDFPGLDRDDAVAFVIGNYAYIGTGMTTGWNNLDDFKKFNLNTETWESCASLPAGEERQYAAGFSHNGLGYLFGGYNGTFLNDFWRYDPTSNSWTEILALPDEGRSGMSSFVIGDTAYILGGKTSGEGAIDEVWAYNLVSGTWTQKSNFPFGKRWRATAIQNGTLSLFGLGKDEVPASHNDFHAYDASTDSWSTIADFPGVGRNYVAGVSHNNRLFAAFGVDDASNFYKDCWEYNPLLDTWTFVADLPDLDRKGGCIFSGANGIYYSTGIDKNYQRLTETWRLSLPLSVEEIDQVNLKIYPNPTNGKVTVHSNFLLVGVELYDAKGRLMMSLNEKQGIQTIDLDGFDNGIYVMKFRSESGNRYQKMLVVE